MPDELAETSSGDQWLQSRKRDWQLRLLLVLGLVVGGVGLALYAWLRAGPASQAGAASLMAPLLYGLIALLVLLDLYVAKKEAVLEGLEREVVHQRIEAELNRELALLDPITEVYNRRYLRIILKKEINRAKRYNTPLCVMLVDITGFRRVNESLGHTGGDVVLRQIANVLRHQTRNSDIIVRFGGDEFLLILPDTEEEGAFTLYDRLKTGLKEWSARSGMTEFGLRLAIGLARYSAERRLDETLKAAEQRMLRDRQTEEPAEKEGRAAPTRAEGTAP